MRGEFVCYPGFEKQVLSANDEFMRVQNGEKNSQICGENLQNELRAKGFENVKRFSWERSAKQIIEIMENLQ